ncbi:MAG TPA: penicillin-binding protein activator [Polyangiales bacterium]
MNDRRWTWAQAGIGCALIFGLAAGCPAAARGPEIGHLPELTSDDPGAEVELREASERNARGEHAAAADAYRAFLKKRPTDRLVPIAQLALGRILLDQGKPDEASALFRAVAAHHDPLVAEHGRFYGGVASERLGQHAVAITALAPMVGRTIEPAETGLLLSTLAAAYVNDGHVAEAIVALQTLSEENVPESDRQAARAQIVELASKKATPADIRKLYDELDHDSYAWRYVALRAVRDADATRDTERTRELLTGLKDHGVAFDDELAAIAMRAEHPSDANPAAVGAILSLSGRARKVGELALRGLMLAAGLPPQGPPTPDTPQIVFRDDAGDPDQAVEAVNELVSAHRVIAIIGPMDAQVALAAGKRAQELGVPLIALTPGAGVAGLGPMVFRYFPTPQAEATALVAQASARGARRFAVLHPANAYGESMLAAFQAAVQSASGSVAATASYAPGTTSFGNAVNTLAKSNFDALFVPDAASTLALIAPALAAAGLWSVEPGQPAPSNGRGIALLAPSVGFDPNLPHLAGRYLQGALFSVAFDALDSSAPTRAFVEQFKQHYASTPDTFAVFAHDAYALVRAAVDAGAKTRAQLAEQLPRARSPALAGPGTGFGASREPLQATRILELKGDAFAPPTAAH